jgi:hypothetical protein
MRYITTLVFLLAPLLASGQKNIFLGKGILDINSTGRMAFSIRFYADTTSKTAIKRVDLFRGEDADMILQDYKKTMDWFKPENIWPGNSILQMRVLQVKGQWYQVMVNNHTGATLWIKASSGQTFRSWPDFLQHRVTWIGKHKDYTPAIKATPSEQSQTLKKIESTDCFEVLEVKGDWIRIRTHTQLECNESKQTIPSGWIRWRQDNHLTIDYGLSC